MHADNQCMAFKSMNISFNSFRLPINSTQTNQCIEQNFQFIKIAFLQGMVGNFMAVMGSNVMGGVA